MDKESFKEIANQWILYDKQILSLQNQLKSIKKIQSNLSSQLISFMDSNHFDQITLHDSKITKTTKNIKKQPNKSFILIQLQSFLQNQDLALQATHFIFSNRPSSSITKLHS